MCSHLDTDVSVWSRPQDDIVERKELYLQRSKSHMVYSRLLHGITFALKNFRPAQVLLVRAFQSAAMKSQKRLRTLSGETERIV